MKKQLYRSISNKKLAGICGGIAEYFDWDPSIIRFGTMVLGLLFFPPIVLAYFIGILIFPKKESLEIIVKPKTQFYRSIQDKKIAGIFGGLAQFFNVNSTLLRIGGIVLCLLSGIFPFLIVYGISCKFVPKEII